MEVECTQQLIAQARQHLGMDPQNHYNLAIVGQSGVGKSSLINGIRLLKDNHPDAAPVGETETTSRIERYSHPTNPKLVLWDVPGAGTTYHPDSTFFPDKMLYAFDGILVIIADRFLQINFDIAKKTMEHNKPCAFVRTKADVAVKSIAERTKKRMRDAGRELKEMVRESMQKGLDETGFSAGKTLPLFIVSARALTRPNAYSLYRHKTGERDSSLEGMDESELSMFVTNLVRAREKERRT